MRIQGLAMLEGSSPRDRASKLPFKFTYAFRVPRPVSEQMFCEMGLYALTSRSSESENQSTERCRPWVLAIVSGLSGDKLGSSPRRTDRVKGTVVALHRSWPAGPGIR